MFPRRVGPLDRDGGRLDILQLESHVRIELVDCNGEKKPEIQYKHPTTCLIRQYKVPLERLSASHFRSFETTLDEIRQIDSRQKRVQAAHFQSLRGRWQIGGKQVRRPID